MHDFLNFFYHLEVEVEAIIFFFGILGEKVFKINSFASTLLVKIK
jgi:hypothetical protein